MHHDACTTRVSPSLVESQIINAIEQLKALTSGASAAGAKVHNLPERPRDIADDGEFHYAVPRSASSLGVWQTKRRSQAVSRRDGPAPGPPPSPIATPSSSPFLPEKVSTRRAGGAREYLGWEEVREQLKDQSIDPIREQMLIKEIEAAKKHIPGAIGQAYSLVVTVNENNGIHAFKVVVDRCTLVHHD